MDVLSEVLKVVQLQGALFYNAELSAPWSIRAASSCAVARYLVPDAKHLIIYHFLTEGRAFLQLENGERIALSAGDLVMIPHGDPHILDNGAAAPPVDDCEHLREVLKQGLRLWRFGGGGEKTK